MAKFKLSLMMLLQYMMYAVWWVPLAAYLTNLEVSSTQKALSAAWPLHWWACWPTDSGRLKKCWQV